MGKKSIKRPTLDELSSLLEVHTQREVAEMYGVTEHTVWVWYRDLRDSGLSSRLTPEKLEELLKTHTKTEIAKMYGVAIQSVANMCYQLDLARRGKVVPSIDELLELRKTMSQKEIAQMYGVSASKISRIFCEAGYAKPKKRVRRPDCHEMVELLKNHTKVQIAAKYGVTRETIHAWCQQDGIRMQPVSPIDGESAEDRQARHEIRGEVMPDDETVVIKMLRSDRDKLRARADKAGLTMVGYICKLVREDLNEEVQ